MNKKDKKFLSEEQRFVDMINTCIDEGVSIDRIIEEKYNEYFPMLPDGEYKKKILLRIYKNYIHRDPDVGHHIVNISSEHISFLNSLPSIRLRALFYSLIVRTKVKPHRSGWISLDFDNTIRYGFSESEAAKIKIEALSVCVPYGFEVRVSGSTKPVLCFRLPEFAESDVVLSFEDGNALEHFQEVLKLGNHSDK